MTLLAVEVSYCEASCALGGGEEMLPKQSEALPSMTAEFVLNLLMNKSTWAGFPAFVGASLPERGKFFALQNWWFFFSIPCPFYRLTGSSVLLFHVPFPCVTSLLVTSAVLHLCPVNNSVTFFVCFLQLRLLVPHLIRARFLFCLLPWCLVWFWKLLFACKAHKDDGMLSVE